MKHILAVLSFWIISQTTLAQVWSAGSHFNGGIAVGGLKDEVGGLFFPSLSGIILYEARTAPVSVGLELGYGIYGSKLERRTDLYPGFNDELRLRRNNNIFTGMAVIRFQTNPQDKIRHFMEAKFGGNYLYTRYKVRETILSEEIIEAGKDMENWTLAFSLGTGFQIPIAAEPGLFLEFKANYQSSSDLRFLTKGDVRFVPLPDGGGEFKFQTRKAPLELVVLSLGLVFVGL